MPRTTEFIYTVIHIDFFNHLFYLLLILSQGMALLHWACDRGHIDVINFLISHDADINIQVRFYHAVIAHFQYNRMIGTLCVGYIKKFKWSISLCKKKMIQSITQTTYMLYEFPIPHNCH